MNWEYLPTDIIDGVRVAALGKFRLDAEQLYQLADAMCRLDHYGVEESEQTWTIPYWPVHERREEEE